MNRLPLSVLNPPIRSRGFARRIQPTLSSLPPDIFLSLASYLHPQDLLHLTRTSKSVRSILLARKSAPIWKTARKTLDGFPSCPPDLQEPQYAHLVFESGCMVCGSPKTHKTDFALRLRACLSCKREITISAAELSKMGWPDVSTKEAILLVPALGVKPNKKVWNRARLLDVVEEYNRLTDRPAELVAFEEKCRMDREAVETHATAVQNWLQDDQTRMRAQRLENIKLALMTVEDANYQDISAFVAQREHKLRQMITDPHELNDRDARKFRELFRAFLQESNAKRAVVHAREMEKAKALGAALDSTTVNLDSDSLRKTLDFAFVRTMPNLNKPLPPP